MRRPQPADARRIWALVRDSGALDCNSPYAYLLVCSHFADTSLVAEAETGIAGFVAAYRLPREPEVVFVWQIGVTPAARGRGLASRLLDGLVAAPGCAGVTTLDATVTPSNRASRSLFEGFARRHGAPCHESLAFGRELFPEPAHEAEFLLRIGPLRSSAVPKG